MKLLIVSFTILLRLLPHLPNFTPIGAMALFGGAHFNKIYSFLFVFGTMLVSDYLLLYVNPFSNKFLDFSVFYPPTFLFHSTSIFVYLSLLIYVFVGKWIAIYKSLNRMIIGVILASTQFFLITNFGVWAMGMYSRGLDGLFQSYIAGLPFFKYTILGDLFYSALFFGIYEIVLRINRKTKQLVLVHG